MAGNSEDGVPFGDGPWPVSLRRDFWVPAEFTRTRPGRSGCRIAWRDARRELECTRRQLMSTTPRFSYERA